MIQQLAYALCAICECDDRWAWQPAIIRRIMDRHAIIIYFNGIPWSHMSIMTISGLYLSDEEVCIFIRYEFEVSLFNGLSVTGSPYRNFIPRVSIPLFLFYFLHKQIKRFLGKIECHSTFIRITSFQDTITKI